MVAKRFGSVLCLLAYACTGKPVAPTPTKAEASPSPLTLSVMATNDVHGHIEQLPLLGGYVRNLRRARARDHGGVLLLDAGDMLQGTLESNLGEGAAAIRAFNALGYAAAAVGNHEFDFGPVGPHPVPFSKEDDPVGALERRAEEAGFPLLSANLRKTDGSLPALPHVAPSTLLEVAGVRVGVVGGITEDALTRTQPANVAGLSLAPLAASVASEAKALHARGATVVIAVVHAGGECHDWHAPDDLGSCDDKAEVFELARHLSASDVDLIVAGHTHEAIAHRVHGIPIIESYSNARAFGRVDLSIDRETGRVSSQRIYEPQALCEPSACASERYEGESVQRDASVEVAIAADLERARGERSRALGVELTTKLERSHKHESALGNLVADLAHKAFPHADAAINNGGSVRTSLPAGKLTYGQLFEMFPFDNAFAELRMTAATLALMIRNNLQADRGFLSLSGLRAEAHCEGDTLLVQLLRENGSRVRPQTPLHVVMSDFLAGGGDDLLRGIPLDPNAIEIHRERMMRDALVKGLESWAGRRIDGSDRTLFDPAHPRIRYSGVRPVHCSVSQ